MFAFVVAEERPQLLLCQPEAVVVHIPCCHRQPHLGKRRLRLQCFLKMVESFSGIARQQLLPFLKLADSLLIVNSILCLSYGNQSQHQEDNIYKFQFHYKDNEQLPFLL